MLPAPAPVGAPRVILVAVIVSRRAVVVAGVAGVVVAAVPRIIIVAAIAASRVVAAIGRVIVAAVVRGIIVAAVVPGIIVAVIAAISPHLGIRLAGGRRHEAKRDGSGKCK